MSAFHPYSRPGFQTNQRIYETIDSFRRFLPEAESLVNTSDEQKTRAESPPASTMPPSNERHRRKRTTFSSDQAARLEQEYLSDCYMGREKRLVLAMSLNLSENQVKTWFQNRRAKDKRDRKSESSPLTLSRKTSPSRSIPSPNNNSNNGHMRSSPVELSTTPPLKQPTSLGSPELANNSIIQDYAAYIQALGASGQLPLLQAQNPSLFNLISTIQSITNCSPHGIINEVNAPTTSPPAPSTNVNPSNNSNNNIPAAQLLPNYI